MALLYREILDGLLTLMIGLTAIALDALGGGIDEVLVGN
jgi:hypothetical protein